MEGYILGKECRLPEICLGSASRESGFDMGMSSDSATKVRIMPEDRKLCKSSTVKLLHYIVGAAVMLAVAGGCSTEHYRAEADKEVYDIIVSKWQDGFGSKSNYTIRDSNVPASPNDIQIERAVPASGVITLAQAVAMATAHNRDYQRQKEQLYLMALDLTLARHQFARQWFGTVDASYVRNSADEQVGYGAETGFRDGRCRRAQAWPPPCP